MLERSGVDGHPRLVARIDRSERAAELRWAGREQLIVSDGPGGSLWRIDLATGRLVGLADRAPLSLASDDTFAVSADGSRVAYTADSPYGSENLTSEGRIPDVFAIGVVSTSGGVARLLSQPEHASDAYPSFSPDGSRIVFARTMLRHGLPVGFGPPSLMVQSVNGGGAKPLNVSGDRPAWSPNGRWIAYQHLVRGASIGQQSGVMGTATVSGKVAIFTLPGLTLGTGVPGTPPQWSPNGKTLLFAATPDSRLETDVYGVGADGHGLHRVG